MSIVWLVLPNGFSSRTFSASIYVAPRLPGTTLAGTPFVNWPQTLATLQFKLAIDPAGGAYTVVPAPVYDAALWTQVFGNATVTPFVFKNNAGRPVWSYSVADAKAFIDGVYAQVQASSATSYPSVDPATQSPLAAALDLVNAANDRRVRTRQELYSKVRGSPSAALWTATALSEQGTVAGLADPASQAIYLGKRFFDRPASATTKDAQGNLLARPRPKLPAFDFHQKMALLADHPYLLRKLGLVLDVTFIPAAAPLPPTGYLRLVVNDGAGLPLAGSVSPRTQYEVLGKDTFRAVNLKGSPDVREGFVPLDDSIYLTSQGEPDGDLHKLVGFATNMALMTTKLTAESAGAATAPPEQTLPARRSAGLYVARANRATSLKGRFAQNAGLDAALNSATPPDLTAEDLLRGYRADVKTSTSAWFSLHKRRITYGFGQANPTPISQGEIADEGYLKANSGTSDASPDGPPDLYLHEVLFGWEGWSLATPRPGRRLMPVFNTPGEAIAAPDDTPSADFPLHAPVRAEPGSLIPLRFGWSYAFRLRAVDLAGNGLKPDAPDTATPHVSALQTYKRHEPVLPPTLVLRWPVTEGESVEHLVIRSGEGLRADPYAALLNATYGDPAFPAKLYRGTAERHVAPPKSTQAFAEAHGDFDGAFAQGADTKAFYRLGTREEGTFSDKRIPSLTVDDGYIDGNPNQAAIITPPQVPLDQRRAADGGAGVSSLTQNRGDTLAPGEYVVCAVSDATLPYLPDSAAGGVVFHDPASATTTVGASWQGTWPDWKPFRLQLAEGGAITGGPVVGRVGTVTLPPGTIFPLEYASVPAANRLGHLAYAIDHNVSAASLATGRHWMVTPRRQVLLVHAVPKPLAPPLLTMTISRLADHTYVTHVGKMQAHSRSTNHVDLEASWDEVLDVPSKPLPDDGVSSPAIKQTGHAYQVPFSYGQDDADVLRLRHDFHDTRHRVVKYTPVATTRYKEYFPAALVADPAKITLAGTAPGPRADGTFSILSASRPVLPRVLYVVPTFSWESSAGSSVRRGGGLRVYLERPWYTTGEGELLAVLLPNANAAAPADRISRWGRDPLFRDGTAAPLSAANFVAPVATAHDLQLGDGSGLVDLVAYPVEFNADRKLWFCDIQINPGNAYFPFVSLSLGRYQPESVKFVELSLPVRADFGQLTPDRALSFTLTAQGVEVALSGVVSDNAAEPLMAPIPLTPPRVGSLRRQAPGTHRVVAYVQERLPGSVGEMGWSAIGGETLLAGARPIFGAVATWLANVPLPAASTPPKERRVVIEEREYFQADQTQLYAFKSAGYTEFRVVYLDTIAIP